MGVLVGNRLDVSLAFNQHTRKAIQILLVIAGTFVNKEKSVGKEAFKAREAIIEKAEVYVASLVCGSLLVK